MGLFTKTKPTSAAATSSGTDSGSASFIAVVINWAVLAFVIFMATSIIAFSVAYEVYFGTRIVGSAIAVIISYIALLLLVIGCFGAVVSIATTLGEGNNQEWRIIGIIIILGLCGLGINVIMDIPEQADRQLVAALEQTETIDEMKRIVSSRAAFSVSSFFDATNKGARLPAVAAFNTEIHTVEKGEILSEIATCYGVTVAQIMQVNESIINASSIRSGQQINIPK